MGTDEEPDEKILQLSDSFPEGSMSDIEVTVRMININYGKNTKLLNACRPLMEYSWFVAEIRKNQETSDIEHAVDKAIDNIPDDFQIRPFLLAHRSEVQGMLLTEYNEVEAMELFKEDGRAEERVNTEIQKKRADAAEKRADAAEKRAGDAEAELGSVTAELDSVTAELAEYKERFGEL